jgi:Pyruvate/2-oxoacid:ferredoxin oxidoreductase delta subunit
MPSREKIIDHLSDVPQMPAKLQRKKKRPREIAVVLEDGCTGCEACIPFCPVDCIEHVPKDKYKDAPIPPVQIRFDECIGCKICVRVCDKMTWSTIRMVPVDEFEKKFEIKIGSTYPGKSSNTLNKPVSLKDFK